ncbi:MAG TPA: lytic transglycosylase, partial [Lamprocystis sp. (in: g-proteobacteria)]|nr:lytic transglycosylase [Lamprocystis sp. (in: g-proteobacteria)]
MRFSTPLVRRLGAPSALFLAVSAISGCATNQHQIADSADDFGGVVSAREYGYVRPAGGESARGRTARQTPVGGGDLWSRVRSDMKLDLRANSRIDAKINAF